MRADPTGDGNVGMRQTVASGGMAGGWIGAIQSLGKRLKLARELGFEPRQAESEPVRAK